MPAQKPKPLPVGELLAAIWRLPPREKARVFWESFKQIFFWVDAVLIMAPVAFMAVLVLLSIAAGFFFYLYWLFTGHPYPYPVH